MLKEHARPGATVYVGCAVVSRVFNELAGHPAILRVLEQIMPEGIEFLSDKLVYKTAAKAFATPYHVDASYWKNTRPKLSVWIPFDDVSEENGTLTVVPGSHLREWRHRLTAGINNEFTEAIENGEIPEGQVVTCKIERGTAIVFSDRLVHGSTSANGMKERYAIISTYHAPGEEPFDLNFEARKVLLKR